MPSVGRVFVLILCQMAAIGAGDSSSNNDDQRQPLNKHSAVLIDRHTTQESMSSDDPWREEEVRERMLQLEKDRILSQIQQWGFNDDDNDNDTNVRARRSISIGNNQSSIGDIGSRAWEADDVNLQIIFAEKIGRGTQTSQCYHQGLHKIASCLSFPMQKHRKTVSRVSLQFYIDSQVAQAEKHLDTSELRTLTFAMGSPRRRKSIDDIKLEDFDAAVNISEIDQVVSIDLSSWLAGRQTRDVWMLKIVCKTCGNHARPLIMYNSHQRPFLDVEFKSSRQKRSKTCTHTLIANGECCMMPVTVSFEQLKLHHWIVYPPLYVTNYCNGHCRQTRLRNYKGLLTESVKINVDQATSFCCSPTHVGPMIVVYQERNGAIKHGRLADMVVYSCGC